MTQPHYFQAGENCFVVEQYNDCAPFASFLPGIAGMRGRPAWVFYVNRGQAIASFGVRNKDGAFLEFFPADKAYQLTASRGFRTFLKVADGGHSLNYEPFQRGAGSEVTQRLYVTPHEVGVEELNPKLGLSLRADVFTLAEAPVAGLLRRVEIVNTADKARQIEIVDGLPQVLPYAMNQWILKFMSRTSEAFMRVEGVAENLPFYRLKVWPTDSPQVEPVIAGNFFVGFLDGQHNQAVVDPERIFGLAGDFAQPERFFSDQPLDFAEQVSGNQTPAAFQHLKLSLQPGESRVFYGVYGHAGSREILDQFLIEAAQPDYFEGKREANRRLVNDISQKAFTATAKPLFDAHARQCYLDNGLRGGFSMPVPGGAHLYLFGRKHGDLERDYNDFLLQDTPYSEGNGDFRDVLQNRRMDLFFDPALDAKNIRYFFNLIQPDGYNPCSLRNSRFALDAPDNFAHFYQRFPVLESLLHKEFKYAELVQALGNTPDAEAMLTAILSEAREMEDAEFDRGYWSDHWTYLVDLLISYAAIFPDRLAGLFQDKTYSFFDPTHAVAPRAQKYVLTANGVRQYNAVQYRPEKKALIDARQQRRYQVRTQAGHGEIVYTSLLGKILTLVANKLATLDPAGVGIEMEADRPGWCDALNGLPGILGSSVNETIELKRLVDFTRSVLSQVDVPCVLPVELAQFVTSLHVLLSRADLTPQLFWQESGALKEAYRDQVFMGFAGAEQALADIQSFLGLVTNYLNTAIDKARTPKGIVTYFAYDAEQYRELETGGLEVTHFRQKQLPLFLEGFVHALRIADPVQAQTLYQAVQNSELFDRKLGMYRVNESLGDDALDLGRIGVFNYGWLENGSIFLHMHYKFVLEMVRAGLIDEFYAHIETLLLPFHEPSEYKRNPIENSSFLVSSGFTIDARQHGRGCVARLSGATVEFLHLWTHLFLGPKPFVLEGDILVFKPRPFLAATFFTGGEQSVTPFADEETLRANSATCTLFGSTLLVYVNPQRRDTFGEDAVKPLQFQLYGRDGTTQSVSTANIEGATAEALRSGQYRRIDVLLG
ncbi:hypothetical protein [Methylomonas methanica]|uniref:Cellobiose phosphorylase n=1 Tax=Methylomonas methanica TaxID=421 RepID=A0A177ME79_METMH|nr:hypothetical protein [Methylomonas methanica]OAI03824.1 hypothetical protein A1332_15040 [Methylomonas methanica]